MFLQRMKTDYSRRPVIWVLRFRDQHGNSIRELAGFDRGRALQRLKLRQKEVGEGTYRSPEQMVEDYEVKTGRPMKPDFRAMFMTFAVGPQTLSDWIRADVFEATFGFRAGTLDPTADLEQAGADTE